MNTLEDLFPIHGLIHGPTSEPESIASRLAGVFDQASLEFSIEIYRSDGSLIRKLSDEKTA
jgi:hypothetical protein